MLEVEHQFWDWVPHQSCRAGEALVLRPCPCQVPPPSILRNALSWALPSWLKEYWELVAPRCNLGTRHEHWCAGTCLEPQFIAMCCNHLPWVSQGRVLLLLCHSSLLVSLTWRFLFLLLRCLQINGLGFSKPGMVLCSFAVIIFVVLHRLCKVSCFSWQAMPAAFSSCPLLMWAPGIPPWVSVSPRNPSWLPPAPCWERARK